MFRYNVLMHASSIQLMDAATCIWRLFISLYMATIFGSIPANIRRNVQVHNSHITMIMAATKSSHFIDGNRVLCALHNVGPLSVSHPHNFTILAINFDLFIAKRTDELTGSNNFKADSQKFCLEQFEFPASATPRPIMR